MSEVSQNQTPEIHELSDEDFLKQDAPPVATQSTETVATEETPANVQKTETVPEKTDEVSVIEPTKTETTPAKTEVETGKETTPVKTEGAQEQVQTQVKEPDYKSFYELLTKPFTANGTEMTVTNPEDMVRLMQQGAGYHKKMEQLKPLTRIGHMLQSHGLMDENQLSYLIDLHLKKPEAIAKLIKDSGIEAYDLGEEKAAAYQPTNRSVSDQVLSVEEVLKDLETNSKSYPRTIQIVGKQWDAQSREVLSTHPQLIRIIDGQVADGTYDKIAQQVNYERNLGRLVGVTDLEAYRMIGQQMFGTQQTQQQQQANIQTQTQVPNAAAQAEAEARKKALAPIPAGGAVVTTPTYKENMSDEEFLKVFNQG